MNSLDRTWDRSYSDTNLLATFSPPVSSPVIIRRTMCVEEILPNYTPSRTGFKPSTYHQWNSMNNLSHQTNVTKDLDFQISNLCLSNVNRNLETTTQNVENDCVPMEVDSFKEESKNEVENFEDVKQNTVRLRNLKADFDLKSVALDGAKKNPKNSHCKVFTVILLLFSCLYCLYYTGFCDILNVQTDSVNLEKLKYELEHKVHLQQSVIETILKTIENQTLHEQKVKLLTFVGPSGVGKTYVTNILKANFLRKCIHELYDSDLNNANIKNNVLSHIKPNCVNLVIIDDLKKPDVINLVKFVQIIKHNYNVLIVSVFSNVQVDKNFHRTISVDDINDIRNYLDDSPLDQQVLIFDEFDELDAKEWVDKQMVTNKVPSKYRQQIIENVMKDHNVKFLGLKGLYGKLVMEIKNLK